MQTINVTSDATVLALAERDLDQLAGEALRLYRAGDVLSLSESPLARSSLVEPCFLAGEAVSPDVRGRAMQAVLRWAVLKLQPAGEPSWIAVAWRAYNVVMSLFIEGRRVSELAELMSLSEQTLFALRLQGISAVARILRSELAAPADADGRRQAALSERYARQAPGERCILRMAAVFRRSAPAGLLFKLGEEAGLADIHTGVQNLVSAGLLVSDDRGSALLARPEMQAFLAGLLTPDERRKWHAAAGEYCLGQRLFLDAARHFRAAGMHESAAQVLIERWRDIADQAQVEELRDCLAQFRPADVLPRAWAQLKIVSGEIAESLDDVDTALAEYQQALGATDLRTKALAYYRRARALELKDIDESLAHYSYSITLLSEAYPADPLLSRIYVDLACIFIQERQDFSKAEMNLMRAQQIVDKADRESWSDLHNAWGELCYRRHDLEAAVEHHWQGWLAAKELNQADRQMRAAHNLGQLYIEMGRYEQGLVYLREGRALARQTGNRKLEAACERSIGACHFWLRQYAEATLCYRTAYGIFAEMKNQNWMAAACYDLAEVYAEVGDWEPGRRFFGEGARTAQVLGSERLQAEFAELARRHPALTEGGWQLGPRQAQAMEYARLRGEVTNREYQKLTGVSQKQAARDLADLAARGFLRRIGGGRSTRYLPANGETQPPGA